MHVKEYTGKSGVFYFDEVIFEGNDGKAGGISDHRPVWAEFRIDLEDDGLTVVQAILSRLNRSKGATWKSVKSYRL